MAKGIYTGIGDIRKAKEIYLGAGSVKKVKEAYIGVGGSIKKIWPQIPKLNEVFADCNVAYFPAYYVNGDEDYLCQLYTTSVIFTGDTITYSEASGYDRNTNMNINDKVFVRIRYGHYTGVNAAILEPPDSLVEDLKNYKRAKLTYYPQSDIGSHSSKTKTVEVDILEIKKVNHTITENYQRRGWFIEITLNYSFWRKNDLAGAGGGRPYTVQLLP